VKLFLIAGLLALVGFMPFVVLRRPWAVRIWSRVKLVVVVYVLVVFLAAILRLLFNWDDIYG
jgi:hypothetical protein